MPSLITPIEDKFKERLDIFPWVNWSEVAREEALKRLLFEKYIRTGKLSDEDWKFCEQIDWHPVDELPLKEEYVKKIKERKKGPFKQFDSVDELFAGLKQ